MRNESPTCRKIPHARAAAVRCLVGLAVVACCTGVASAATASEDVSAVLKKMTQEFSDAGQRGDASTMALILDDQVVFVNEGGDVATKAEMLAAATPPPAGVRIQMAIKDWNCRVFGDVAVASFVDDQIVNSHGEVMHAQYRSVETWRKSAGKWHMIGSETIALQDDPSAVALSPEALDEYAGTYQGNSGMRFVFTRSGERLFASVDGGPLTAQSAEVRDVFFTPGRARIRKVFQRDAKGSVTGFAYRREGHDTNFRRL